MARWDHDGVPVSPDFFLPLAARSNLLPALSALMVEQTCSQLRRWRDQGHHRLRVALDIPPRLLSDRSFPSRMAAQVRQAGLHPRSLVLEITEEALVSDLDTGFQLTLVAEGIERVSQATALADLGATHSQGYLYGPPVPANELALNLLPLTQRVTA